MKRQGPARIPDRPNGAGGYAEQGAKPEPLTRLEPPPCSPEGELNRARPPGSRRGRGFGGSAPVIRGAGGNAPCWGTP